MVEDPGTGVDIVADATEGDAGHQPDGRDPQLLLYGSLREEIRRGDLIILDQFIDFSSFRPHFQGQPGFFRSVLKIKYFH